MLPISICLEVSKHVFTVSHLECRQCQSKHFRTCFRLCTVKRSFSEMGKQPSKNLKWSKDYKWFLTFIPSLKNAFDNESLNQWGMLSPIHLPEASILFWTWTLQKHHLRTELYSLSLSLMDFF